MTGPPWVPDEDHGPRSAERPLGDGSTSLNNRYDSHQTSHVTDDPPRQQSTDGGDRPHVHILGMGGTIANVSGEYDDRTGFLSVEELLEHAPAVSEVARLTSTDCYRYVSESLTPAVWSTVYEEISERVAVADPPDGFVVTHGSNSAEETAYFLNLALASDRPVVVTAAQRGVTDLGTDGFKNLYDAIRVAATPAAAGRGTLLVANDEIHHARDVTKLASSRPDAWESPIGGAVGLASPDTPITFFRSVERQTTPEGIFDLGHGNDLALNEIKVVFASVAAEDTLVDAAIDTGAAGIVVAGFPTGHAASPNGPSQSEALDRATAKKIPVVVTSRGHNGRISPADMEHHDSDYWIAGDTLRPQKARVLLALGLTETSHPKRLQEFFTTY